MDRAGGIDGAGGMDDADLADTVITPPRLLGRGESSRSERGPASTGADTAELDTLLRDRATVPPALVEPPSDGRPRRAEHVATAPVAIARTVSARYRYALNGAAPATLDSPLLIGRKPQVPRVTTGAPPQLVAVSSPLREVSGTHVEIRQDGPSIVVTDLRSTNGTVVTMPGSDAFGLRPGESVVAVPGTLVDIGEGNHIEILSVERSAPPAVGRQGGRES